jgi:UPF0716 protein FxsA
MPLALIPLLLLLLPAIEIAVFIYVGQAIGVGKVLALVFLSAILGALLVRHQGLSALRTINRDIRQGQPPAQGLVDGVMIVIGGILLIIPGFVSDVVGLLLMVPPVRRGLWSLIRSRLVVTEFTVNSSGFRRRREDGVVDLSPEDFERREEDPPKRDRLDHGDGSRGL